MRCVNITAVAKKIRRKSLDLKLPSLKNTVSDSNKQSKEHVDSAEPKEFKRKESAIWNVSLFHSRMLLNWAGSKCIDVFETSPVVDRSR